jgi:PAS domain S-box-containing protein
MLDLAQRVARAVAFHLEVAPGAVQQWSHELEVLHGLGPGSFDGSQASWRKLIHVEDWPHVLAAIRRANDTGDVTFEYRVVHQDKSVHWLQAKGRFFLGPDTSPLRIVGFMLDVTERHQAEVELQRLEVQLRQAQRLEAMGTLAGGIAHDFNNILGAILGYGEMAARDAQPGTRLKRDLDSIMAAGERGRALVDRILAFSRSGVGERVPVNVANIVREALEHVVAAAPQGVTVEARLDSGNAAMMGDPTQVHQVVMNLATNAIQAMPEGGRVSVTLGIDRLEAPRLLTTGQVDAGPYLVLTMADSGVGIASEILDRIFDPFFTTKEVGVGTGLGLSLVHGIVSELGGAIDVSTSLGMGSVFTAYLPQAGYAADTVAGHAQQLPTGQGQRVIVVDDEEALARLMGENLVALGYSTVTFSSSLEALRAIHSHPDDFDVLLTDERMPGMSGTTLIQEVRRVRPDVAIVVASGNLSPDLVGRIRSAGADGLLRKPILLRDLALVMARVLHGEEGLFSSQAEGTTAGA